MMKRSVKLLPVYSGEGAADLRETVGESDRHIVPRAAIQIADQHLQLLVAGVWCGRPTSPFRIAKMRHVVMNLNGPISASQDDPRSRQSRVPWADIIGE